MHLSQGAAEGFDGGDEFTGFDCFDGHCDVLDEKAVAV